MQNKNNSLVLISILIVLSVIVAGFMVLKNNGAANPSAQVHSNVPLVEIIDGIQKVAVTVNTNNYSPEVIKVKKDVPVELTFLGQGYGCSTAIISRDFWSGVKYVEKGETEVVSFTPTNTGRYKYTCTMGMYSAWIEVV